MKHLEEFDCSKPDACDLRMTHFLALPVAFIEVKVCIFIQELNMKAQDSENLVMSLNYNVVCKYVI